MEIIGKIDLNIKEGDFVIILGESGCGKSTLLSMIAGLMPLTSGEIRVDDEKVVSPHPSRSILFQQSSLLPWLNVEDNITFGCKLREDMDNLQFRVNQLIEIMGLSGSEKVHPPELSVGMAQRVCLARALIGHPEILLMDEPFAALDTFNRQHLQEELIEFWQIENFTAIFVTHDIDEAILMGNRIVLLGGRPCRIMEVFDVDLNYPRKMTDKAFFKIRSSILTKFRESLVNNNTF